MKIHSEQLFNYLEKEGVELTPIQKGKMIEIIIYGKNDEGKYIQQREESYGG